LAFGRTGGVGRGRSGCPDELAFGARSDSNALASTIGAETAGRHGGSALPNQEPEFQGQGGLILNSYQSPTIERKSLPGALEAHRARGSASGTHPAPAFERHGTHTILRRRRFLHHHESTPTSTSRTARPKLLFGAPGDERLDAVSSPNRSP